MHLLMHTTGWGKAANAACCENERLTTVQFSWHPFTARFHSARACWLLDELLMNATKYAC